MTQFSVNDPLATNAWKLLLARTCGISYYLEALSNLDEHGHRDWYLAQGLLVLDYEDMRSLHRLNSLGPLTYSRTLKRLVPAT